MPGMRTSSSRQAGWRWRGRSSSMSSKASALENASLSTRRERSSQASASRTSASSSTMYTVAWDAGSISVQFINLRSTRSAAYATGYFRRGPPCKGRPAARVASPFQGEAAQPLRG